MFPINKGGAPLQAHVNLPEGTFEEEYGRSGFFGRATHLYHRNAPTGWTRIEGPTRPRAMNVAALVPADHADVRGLPQPFLRNADVTLAMSRRQEAMPFWFRDADCDLVHFVHQGTGLLETDFGPLRYARGDYLVIPRGITHRWVPDAGVEQMQLVIASATEIRLPERGMLGPHALFDPGVIRTPEPEAHQETGEFEVLIRRRGTLTSVWYPFHPLDVVAWKGDATVWQLNVRDIRPVVSPRYHLPPSVHTTFLAQNFVICSFLPRPLETGDPGALRVPFFHRNTDFDEVIFYHDGNFFSRDGIRAGWVTYHPYGIHHGPHPKALANQHLKHETDEQAVMIDARNPLEIVPEAAHVDWAEYPETWSRQVSPQ